MQISLYFLSCLDIELSFVSWSKSESSTSIYLSITKFLNMWSLLFDDFMFFWKSSLSLLRHFTTIIIIYMISWLWACVCVAFWGVVSVFGLSWLLLFQLLLVSVLRKNDFGYNYTSRELEIFSNSCLTCKLKTWSCSCSEWSESFGVLLFWWSEHELCVRRFKTLQNMVDEFLVKSSLIDRYAYSAWVCNMWIRPAKPSRIAVYLIGRSLWEIPRPLDKSG